MVHFFFSLEAETLRTGCQGNGTATQSLRLEAGRRAAAARAQRTAREMVQGSLEFPGARHLQSDLCLYVS